MYKYKFNDTHDGFDKARNNLLEKNNFCSGSNFARLRKERDTLYFRRNTTFLHFAFTRNVRSGETPYKRVHLFDNFHISCLCGLEKNKLRCLLHYNRKCFCFSGKRKSETLLLILTSKVMLSFVVL